MIARVPQLAALAAWLAAACAQQGSYLEASLPEPCTARDVEGCLGWMMERDLSAAQLDLYDDAALRDYVQGIADRLARNANLAHAPRIVISDHDATYSTSGSRIVLARPTLQRMDSEAELAGVIAHELAHIEGHHAVVSLFGPPPDDDATTTRRDAEAIADERAVALLERTGYAPTAMARALRAVLDFEDDDHPLRADRIARVTVLAGGRRGFEGRGELLRHLAHMVVGHDSRLGHRVDDVWVIAALGLALDLQAGDVIRVTDDALVLRRGRTTLAIYAIGAPWARSLAATLDDREAEDRPLGRLTLGTVRGLDEQAARGPADGDAPDGHDGDGVSFDTAGGDSPMARLARAVRTTLPQPPAGSRIALLEREHGALVIELSGKSLPELGLRHATAHELAVAEPPRLRVAYAAHAGTVAQVRACDGRLLDDPDRHVAAGDPIKCSDQ